LIHKFRLIIVICRKEKDAEENRKQKEMELFEKEFQVKRDP